MEQYLNKKWAVVTGATSETGFTVARDLTEEGYDLLLVSENQAVAERAQALARFGTEVQWLQLDLARRADVEHLLARIHLEGRHPGVFVINVANGVNGTAFDPSDLDAELDLIQLHLSTVVQLTRGVVPAMVAAGRGRLQFTSVVAAPVPGSFGVVCSTAESFVENFVEALGSELAGTGVTVSFTRAMPAAPLDTPALARATMPV